MPYKDPEKQRTYQRERVRRIRKEWVDANGPCKECGSWDDLEVDHVDPSKKIDHKVWSWSEKRRKKELAKCQLLCRPCHYKKTAKEKAKPIPHGTDSGYTKRKCRCAECREAHRIAKKNYRAEVRRMGRVPK